MDRLINRKGRHITQILAFVVMLLLAVSLPMTVNAAAGELYIPVTQVFTSDLTVANTFNYCLVSLDASNPMPAGSTADGYSFSITGTDTFEIGPINYTVTGIYEYQLTQVVASEVPGYTYDRQVYDIIAYVAENLDIELVILNLTRDKGDEAEFRNKYEARATDPALMVDPPVRKIVKGNPSSASIFRFRLEAQNRSNPMPAGSVNGMKEVTVTGAGEAEFGTWSYTAEGVYFYKIFEVNSSASGYTYDTMVYTITDTVTLQGNQLILSRIVVNNVNRAVEVCEFTNTYSAKRNVPGPFTGDKANILFYYVLLVISSVLIIGAIIHVTKKRATVKRHR